MSTLSDLKSQLQAAQDKRAALVTELGKWKSQFELYQESQCYGKKPDYLYNQCVSFNAQKRAEATTNINRLNPLITAQDQIIKDITDSMNKIAPNDPEVIAAINQSKAIEAGKSKLIYIILGGLALISILLFVYFKFIRKSS